MKNKINKLTIGLGCVGITTTGLSLALCSCGPTQFIAYLANPTTDGFTISNTEAKKGESFSTIIKSTNSEINEDSLSNVIIGGKIISSSDYSFEPSNDDGWKLTIDGQKVTGDICITMKLNPIAPTAEYAAYLANPITDGYEIDTKKVIKNETFSTIISSTKFIINEDSLTNVIIAGKPIQSTDYSFEPSNDDGWKLTIEGQKVVGDICITMKSDYTEESGEITENISDRSVGIPSDEVQGAHSFGQFTINDSLVADDNEIPCHVFLSIPSLNYYFEDVDVQGYVGFGNSMNDDYDDNFKNNQKSLYLNFYYSAALHNIWTDGKEHEVKINIYRENLIDGKMILAYSSDSGLHKPFSIKKISQP